MIRAITGLFRAAGRGLRLWPFFALLVGYALSQGLAFLAIIPVLEALATRDWAGAWISIAVLTVLALVASSLFYLQARSGYLTSLELVRVLQQRIGDAAARLPLGWFDRARSGQLAQLTSKSAEDVGTLTAHLLQPVFTALLTPLVVALGLFFWDVRLGLAGAAFIPVAIVIGWLTPKLTAAQDALLDQRTAEVNEQVVDLALSQPVLRSAQRGVGNYPPLDDALDEQYAAQRRGLWLVLPGMLANTVMVQLWLVLLLFVALSLALGGDLPVPAAIGLIVVAVRFVGPLSELSEHASVLRAISDSLGRINALLDTPTLPEPARPATVPSDELSITFDQVAFSYRNEDVLRDLSFRLEPGTLTALVGPSGAGKTTILRLIARFWDAGSGAVRFDGVDVRALGSDEVIDRVAVVFQDVYLFEGSILDNIRVGRPGASDQDVAAAVAAARVEEIAQRLPDGLDTQVGEGGSLLSGGERQRVSIARAILKDAPIVLLDEATAAVDTESEAALATAFQQLAVGRTVVAIAHRLETIRGADRILFLDGGRIIEDGDHSTLVSRGGRYASFWRAKERAASWTL